MRRGGLGGRDRPCDAVCLGSPVVCRSLVRIAILKTAWISRRVIVGLLLQCLCNTKSQPSRPVRPGVSGKTKEQA